MTAFLVDTQATLWFLTDDPQLSSRAKTSMEDPAHLLLVSSATIWEAAIKSGLGKLRAPTDLPAVLEAEGFVELPVRSTHAWRVQALPRLPDHKDPFDRLLVAQALIEGHPIISGDAHLDRYGITRVW